ncbi:MAG: hypothetical protein ACRDRQ_20075 [Pseudonocardiaceae bacterium]
MTQKPQPLRPVPSSPIYSQSIEDVDLPGVVVEVDPDDAEEMGAFPEDALTLDDVLQAEFGGDAA